MISKRVPIRVKVHADEDVGISTRDALPKTSRREEHKISRRSSRFFVFIGEARMSANSSPDPKFNIGHVLFIDIVGYSKLLISEQSELIRQLKDVVSGSEQFRSAEVAGKLVRLPTGAGMALVFRDSAETPAKC